MTIRELATKTAFEEVPQTYPIIDKKAKLAIKYIIDEIICEQGTISSSLSHDIEYTINSLIDVVKEQTELLRTALIDAHEARLDMHKAYEDLNEELFDAKKTISYQEEEIKDRDFWDKQERYY